MGTPVYGFATQPHQRSSAEVTGTVETGLSSCEEVGEAHHTTRFKYQTKLTRPGPAIAAFHDGLELDNSNLDRAVARVNALYTRFRYVSGSTGIRSTAGRDSRDRSINRGVFIGAARQYHTVS